MSSNPSNSTILARLLRGTGAQGFCQAVNTVIRLAEVPLFLGFWGPRLYGEWLMLSAIPTYLSMSDGGFATTACREMTMRSGAGDTDGAIAVFQSTWLLLIAVSIAAGLLVFGFAEAAPLKNWLHFSIMNSHEIRIVLLLLAADVLVGFQGGLLNGGFWIVGRYPTGMFYGAVAQLLQFLGLAVAVFLGGGPIKAALGYLLGRVTGIAIAWLGQRRVSPWLRHGFSQASLTELRRLIVPAFASLAFPLGNAFNIQGMRLVVGLVLGPAAVAVFTPLRTLSRLASKPRVAINQIIQPELALAFGAEDPPLFRRLFLRSCQLSFWACLGACLFLVAAAGWILPIWTTGKILMDWPTFGVLLAGVLINSIWYTALMAAYATNRHERIAPFYILIYGACAFAIAYVEAMHLGLVGAAFALLLVELAMAVVVLRFSLRMAAVGIKSWGRVALWPPVDIFSETATNLRKRMTAAP